MEPDQPISRQDLNEALNRAVQAIAAAIQAEIQASEQRTNARIEQVETSLLTEFHKWASPAEMRARSHAAALRAIDAEMEFLSDRVTKLEGKPPQSSAQ
jgi:uncharacterized membrane protein YgcG